MAAWRRRRRRRRRRGVHAVIMAGWIREIRGGSSVVELDTDTRTRPLKRTNSQIQGDPAVPEQFQAAPDGIAWAFMEWRANKGYSYKMGKVWFLTNLLVFF
jgi:hypothetical protein